jgi:hypothetical protein
MDTGISSSTVILTRNIMGQIDVGPPKAPSSKWVWDDAVAINDDGIPYMVETRDQTIQRCSAGCKYRVANPANWGKKLTVQVPSLGGAKVDVEKNGDAVFTETGGIIVIELFKQDLNAWRSDQRIASLRTKNNGKKVYMWNPSDDPGDANGSQAVNYDNHGALTKLFLKPTLPFNVTFST